MQLKQSIRSITRRALGQSLTRRLRRAFTPTLSSVALYELLLTGKQALEIGGPSEIFSDDGFLSLYRVLARVDNCLFSARTVWTGEVQGGRTFRYHPQREQGFQFICEATDLSPIQSGSYDCILASHCLEHVANPLRALAEWKRALKKDGMLLLILPHKDGTFDWGRPTTTLHHVIEDRDRSVGEDDLSHLPEILALHDLSKDKRAGSHEQFRQRCLDNYSHRAMHHHVFDSPAAVAIIDHAGFKVIRVDTLKPYHIIILARRCVDLPQNEEFLCSRASYREASPFPSDRAKMKA